MGGPAEVPCRPPRATVPAGMSQPAAVSSYFSDWPVSRSLYILKISEDPQRALVYMGYIAIDIYHTRNQN